MKVSINGEPRELKEGATILELLQELGVVRERVAVEVNTEVVRKTHHAERRLAEGDKVEIVTFVGGG